MGAQEQDAEAEKKTKQNRKRFVDLLQKAREIKADSSYRQAEKALGGTSAWEGVDEATRKQCFKIFIDQLKLQGADDASDDAEKKKKRRRGSSEDEEPRRSKKSKKDDADDRSEEVQAKDKKRKRR